MKTALLSSDIEAINGAKMTLGTALHLPNLRGPDTIFFCLPGGGVSRDLFDLGQYGDVDYSFVSRMNALGHTVITMDNPGTGSNPLPEGHPFLMPRQSSKYIHEALQGSMRQAGLENHKIIGLGHSMGGMLTVLTQGRHRPFSGVALLGSSAGGLDWGLDDHEKTYIGKPDAVEQDLEELVNRKFGSEFLQVKGGPTGNSITFGGATEEVTERLREISIELYAAGGMMSMIRGSFSTEVESINVPLFFAFGDHDIGVPPEEAPGPFTGTDQVEVHVLENCGHNSLAFPVIADLCENLDSWAAKL